MLQQKLTKDFDKRFRYWRKKRGLSKVAISKACGVAESTIASYEFGRYIPRLDTLEILLDALEVDIGEFFAEEI